MSTAALATPRPALPQPFQAPEHEPFYWPNGEDAVLLVHGFPGTPAEMRPLAQHLHEQGWTPRGILLPGFGPNMPRLADYTDHDWQQTVNSAVAELAATHRSVAVIGNSIGAMLALRSALHAPVAALVLIAPFWRVERRWLDLVFPLLKPFASRLHPFRRADFTDSEFRASLRQILGDEVDLDDPAVQSAIRDLPLPITALANVRRIGHAGYAAADSVPTPVCIVQGCDDPIAVPSLTQRFAQRLSNLRGYIQIHGHHDLVRQRFDPSSPAAHFIHDFLTTTTLEHTGQVQETNAY